MVGQLIGWSVRQSVGRSVGRLVGWSVSRSVGWSISRSVDWSFGPLVCPSVRLSVRPSVSGQSVSQSVNIQIVYNKYELKTNLSQFTQEGLNSVMILK